MEEIAIYGAGAFGKIFYQALGGQIDCFVDDYFPSTKVYISALQNSDKIQNHLISHGYENVFSFGQSIQQIPNLLREIAKTDYLWMTDDSSVMVDEKKLDNVFSLLKDQDSKNLLTRMIRLRQTLEPEFYIQPQGIEYLRMYHLWMVLKIFVILTVEHIPVILRRLCYNKRNLLCELSFHLNRITIIFPCFKRHLLI